eukprot:g18494.t1
MAHPTALHAAAEANDAAGVKALLRGGGADPNARVAHRNFDHGATALHVAAQKGHLEAALALLEGGAKPDGRRTATPRSGSGNAVDSSSSSDMSDISDISDISDSDLSDHAGEWEGDPTPLHLACAGGHTKVVRALLSAGERTDRIASGRKVCGLDLGGRLDNGNGNGDGSGNDAPVTNRFGGIGAGPMPPFFGAGGERDGGHTPMHLASVCGAAGVVRVLVEAGASVHRRAGDCDDTPLHLASAAGQVEVVAALLEAGADINAEDEIGNTPLHVALDARTLEFLLARGANPNLVAMSCYGSGSPLGSYCTLLHRLETDEKGMASATAQVETLLRYGADVNITANASSHDHEPTHLQREAGTVSSPILSSAAKNGIPGIVSALLRAGLDPNQRDRDGWAPLHDAAQGNHLDVLRVLLRAGAEKDAATLRGRWTPLHVACRYTSVECVLELLQWGANLGPTARPVAPLSKNGIACPCRLGSEGSFVCDAHGAVAVSDGRQEDEGGDDEESGYVEARDRAATVGERNAIRRALRCEAAWRRRRSVVLLKTHLKNQPPHLAGFPSPNLVAGGSGTAGDIRAGKLKRVGGAGVHPHAAKSARMVATAGGTDGVDGSLLLRSVLEGVVNLAAREEALFRQIVLFL